MLSRNLEQSLHRALAHANERRHEYATLEHLLLALVEDQDALAVLKACGIDLDRLRRDASWREKQAILETEQRITEDAARAPDLDDDSISDDMLRLMFVLEGCRSRSDLEARMDWGNKGRVLVLEKISD